MAGGQYQSSLLLSTPEINVNAQLLDCSISSRILRHCVGVKYTLSLIKLFVISSIGSFSRKSFLQTKLPSQEEKMVLCVGMMCFSPYMQAPTP